MRKNTQPTCVILFGSVVCITGKCIREKKRGGHLHQLCTYRQPAILSPTCVKKCRESWVGQNIARFGWISNLLVRIASHRKLKFNCVRRTRSSSLCQKAGWRRNGANVNWQLQRIAATVASNAPLLLASLAGNPSLTETLMKKFAEYEDSQPAPGGRWFVGVGWMVRAGLAVNSALPESLQAKLSKDDRSEVRASLACNLSLSESLQARLAEDRDEDVQNKLAGNPSLTVAQQAQLASTGNVDIRLGLMDNPVLDERIKRRIIASFTENDLRGAENEVKCASDRLDRFSLEDIAAQKKSVDAFMIIDIPFFNSATKKERLEAEANRTSEQCIKATSEYFSLCNKLAKIKKLISLQSPLPGA